MNHLIYINGLGPNYKGDNIYEFIFSNTLEVFGENWESKPANGYPSPPDIEYIKKVGTLINENILRCFFSYRLNGHSNCVRVGKRKR
jgi:hypothetical protein